MLKHGEGYTKNEDMSGEERGLAGLSMFMHFPISAAVTKTT